MGRPWPTLIYHDPDCLQTKYDLPVDDCRDAVQGILERMIPTTATFAANMAQHYIGLFKMELFWCVMDGVCAV